MNCTEREAQEDRAKRQAERELASLVALMRDETDTEERTQLQDSIDEIEEWLDEWPDNMRPLGMLIG